MSVWNPACVLTATVRISPELTVACAMRVSSRPQTAKAALVSISRASCVNDSFSTFRLSVCVSSSWTDINECEDFRLCANGRCINTEGSFQCQCYSGFQRTQEGSHCEGTNHSTRACVQPMTWNSDSSNSQVGKCESNILVSFPTDINECKRPSNCLRGHCFNNMGSYHCECQKGHVLVGGRRCQGQHSN